MNAGKGIRMDLSGKWTVRLQDGTEAQALLPGTLDENGIGVPDRPEKLWQSAAPAFSGENGAQGIGTRFTRKVTYTGPACFTRKILWEGTPEGRRCIIRVERSRKLQLTVNGQEARPLLPGTLSTPWVFETEALRPGENEICFICDNSYPEWPAEAILYSSAATDETQTNWNGLIGDIRLETKPSVFLLNPRMVMNAEGSSVCFQAEVCAPEGATESGVTIRMESDALAGGVWEHPERLSGGIRTICIPGIPLTENVRKWQMEDPQLYTIRVALQANGHPGETDETVLLTGFRTFLPDGEHRLCLNGQRIFLRGEANCAAWPETGHPPMTEGEWEEMLRRYQAYGVNCMRFHSHCPPEAAFAAADRIGMLMQPELSHWDPAHAFESDVSFKYYREELTEILRMLGKHPSFVMLTLGNELSCDEKGQERMAKLVRCAKETLPDRLYAWGSNAFYGAKGCDTESDFYTAQNFGKWQMRAISAAQDEEHPDRKTRIKGYLNNTYPSARANYREGMAALREAFPQPMFSFEVGQYEVLPDFGEMAAFRGVTEPVNYRMIREKAEKKGLLPLWNQMVEAGGELALIGYREETEAVMRTPGMSGLSLLSLQDFPGQGTALVGMMNAHLQPKPFGFAQPERFRAFFRDAVLLPEVEKYTWTAGETLRAPLRCVNYGAKDLRGDLRVSLVLQQEAGEETLAEQVIPDLDIPAGSAEIRGEVCLTLPPIEKAVTAEMILRMAEEEDRFCGRRRIWIYPEEAEVSADGVLRAERVTEEVLSALERGERVLLEPPSTEEALPGSIQGQFTTDFWSVGTFPQQEGGMGLLIQEDHPLFSDFPTAFHTDYQWWLMAGQRALRLPDERYAGGVLVRQMDSFATLRSFAMLMEVRVGPGRLMISTMDLKRLPPKPEVRALQNAILKYMKTGAFSPKTEMTPEALRALLP